MQLPGGYPRGSSPGGCGQAEAQEGKHRPALSPVTADQVTGQSKRAAPHGEQGLPEPPLQKHGTDYVMWNTFVLLSINMHL